MFKRACQLRHAFFIVCKLFISKLLTSLKELLKLSCACYKLPGSTSNRYKLIKLKEGI